MCSNHSQASKNLNGSPFCVVSIFKLIRTGTVILACSKYSQASKNWYGSFPVCRIYSQASKNWNNSPLCVVSIVKLERTGMVLPCVFYLYYLGNI